MPGGSHFAAEKASTEAYRTKSVVDRLATHEMQPPSARHGKDVKVKSAIMVFQKGDHKQK